MLEVMLILSAASKILQLQQKQHVVGIPHQMIISFEKTLEQLIQMIFVK
jgi:hypothetical protein